MRVSRTEKAANRERVVEVASALYRKHGFDGVGVADIMKKAGLTHGGFYGHFGSKDDLAAEACTSALRGSDSWISASEKGGLEAAVRNYLTPEHRDDRAKGSVHRQVRPSLPVHVHGALSPTVPAACGRPCQSWFGSLLSSHGERSVAVGQYRNPARRRDNHARDRRDVPV